MCWKKAPVTEAEGGIVEAAEVALYWNDAEFAAISFVQREKEVFLL